MKSEEYANKYREKLLSCHSKNFCGNPEERKAEEFKIINQTMMELNIELHKEMVKTLFDQNLNPHNSKQWPSVIAVVKNFNEKCNSIYKKLGLEKVKDIFKHSMTCENEVMTKCWDMTKEELIHYSKDMGHWIQSVSNHRAFGKKQ